MPGSWGQKPWRASTWAVFQPEISLPSYSTFDTKIGYARRSASPPVQPTAAPPDRSRMIVRPSIKLHEIICPANRRTTSVLTPASAGVHGPGSAETVERIINVFVEHRQEEERFLDTFRRIGVAPFKAKVYAPAHQAGF